MIDENGIMICDVCGTTCNEKIVQWVGRANMHLCSKHKKQIYEYGKITDSTARTTHDRNEYILHDDYAEMVLRDRRNNIVGYAKIDLDDVEKCKQQKWSYPKKTSSTQKYVRAKNTKINISLQRYILGYDGPLVVDHINRDTLDNRKSNLRIVTVAENTANNGHPGIYQIANGKWKVKLRRYGKHYYSYGAGFDTYEEAVVFRDSILSFVENHKDELRKEFEYDRKTQLPGTVLCPNGKWQATYCIDGKQIRVSGFPTSEAAANYRAKMIGVITHAG